MTHTKSSSFHGSGRNQDKSGIIHSLLDFVFQLILSLLILILSPISIILSLPFLIIRNLVKFSARIFRKDFSSMIPIRSTLFAIDKITSSPKCNIVVCVIAEGAVEMKTIRSIFYDRLFKSLPKDSEGNDRYQELYQYIVKWGGYFFWKTDENFNEDNHFKSLPDDKEYNEGDLKALAQSYVGRKWPSEKPTWEVLLIPKYSPSYSLSTGKLWKEELKNMYTKLMIIIILQDHTLLLFSLAIIQ